MRFFLFYSTYLFWFLFIKFEYWNKYSKQNFDEELFFEESRKWREKKTIFYKCLASKDSVLEKQDSSFFSLRHSKLRKIAQWKIYFEVEIIKNKLQSKEKKKENTAFV